MAVVEVAIFVGIAPRAVGVSHHRETRSPLHCGPSGGGGFGTWGSFRSCCWAVPYCVSVCGREAIAGFAGHWGGGLHPDSDMVETEFPLSWARSYTCVPSKCVDS